MAKNNKTVKRGVYLYIDGKEIKNDINSIDLEMKRLQRDIKDMTRGSEEYNRTMVKIQHLQGILKQHRQEIRGITTETKKATISIGSMVDWFNRFGGVILSVIGFLTGFTLALRAIRDERNKLEESQAGLKALTGLDDDNIAWLTEQAKTLSTTMTKEGLRVRQSAAEILDAFMLVGSAKPELLGNKEALKAVTEEAMRLQAAAKDITLSEAVDSLTLSLNQYGEAADQAGRFVNVLAAGSKEGAANIASQAKAIQKAGTIAASSNIPIEELVGTIEMLGEKGIKDEVAGTGLKTFFTRLATGAEDTNPKIVGLATALENLNKKVAAAEAKKAGGGTSLLKTLFGDEGMQTAMILSQNTEQVKKYTAAVTDTNVAYEQATINSDTAAAKLAQARNNMKLAAIDLGEKLNPALAVSTNMLTNVIKFLPGLIDWFKKWGGTALWLGTIFVAYAARLRIITTWQTAWNALTKVATILNLAYAASMNTLSGYTVTSFGNLRKLSTLMQGHAVLLKSLRVATYLYAGAVQVLRGRVDLAAKSMKAAWTIMSGNPIGLLVTMLLAAVTASYKLTQRTKEYYDLNKVNEKITEKTNDEYERQSSLIDRLTTKIHDNNLSNHERRKAIKQLQDIIPDYHAEIDKEGKLINENTTAIEQYNAALATNIELKEVSAELDKHRSNLTKLQKSPSLRDNSLMGSMAREDTRTKIAQEEEIIKSLTERYQKLTQEKDKALNPDPDNDPNGTGEDGKKCPICGNNPCTCDEDKSGKDKFAQAEAAHYKRIAAIKKRYLEDDKMTQEEYNRQMREADLQLLNDKLKAKGVTPAEIQRINDQILDAEIKARDELHKIDEQAAKDAEKQRQEQAEATYSRLEKEYQMQVEAATIHHYKHKTSEKEYLEELLRIQEEYYAKILNDTTVNEEKKNEIRKLMRERDIKDAQEKYDKELDEQKEMARLYLDIAQDTGTALGTALADVLTAQDNAMKNLWKNLLLTAVNAIEQYLRLTYIKVLADSIIGLKFWKALPALAKIAAIEASFAAVKGTISNFYTGGYTGPGDWDQPQGIVHSNEFVANRFAVANPNLRPIFDVIDVAQRTGNVGNLTAEDIAAVAGSGKSTRTVPAKAPAASATTTTNDPAMVAMLVECTRVLRKLKNRLDNPLIAETYVTGKRGINRAQKEYDKLIKNVSR